MSTSEKALPSGRFPSGSRFWLVATVLLATVPVMGMFRPDRVFHVRDLSLVFWGRYLWLRRSLWEGRFPLWDQYIGGGQSAVADAMHQLFLLPTLALRMVGTETLGFNLWVGLPLPVSAAGMFVYLQRRFSKEAAALGATAFALSGVVVSSCNFPNLSWTIAFLPWVLWTADRCLADVSARTVAGTALAVALQGLAGEPVTHAATLALVVTLPWTGAHRSQAGSWRSGLFLLAGVGGGVALEAIQVLPMLEAVRGSWRQQPQEADFWALHPVGLLEAVSPHLFGDYFKGPVAAHPWMAPLNSGRDPFFYSLYWGPLVLALAAAGALSGRSRTWSRYWVVASAMGLCLAFGSYSPLLPALRGIVPAFSAFRFPAKFMVVLAAGVAALVAAGWDGMMNADLAPAKRGTRWWTALVFPTGLAVAAALVASAAMYAPDTAARWLLSIATRLATAEPASAAGVMLKTLPEAGARLLLVAGAATALLWMVRSGRKEARLAKYLFFLVACIDLLVQALPVNPMVPSEVFAEPAWVAMVRRAPGARFYFGGKWRGIYDVADPDGAREVVLGNDVPLDEARSRINLLSVLSPGAYGIREMLSYDLAVLWPRPFLMVASRFRLAAAEERGRFLQRTGVQFRVIPSRTGAGRVPIAALPILRDMHLFDVGDVTPRAYIVSGEAHTGSVEAQISTLFSAIAEPLKNVMLASAPSSPAGREGPPEPPSAKFIEDTAHAVVIDARVGAPTGFLVLLDSYDPNWTVTVDGEPAPLLQAHAIFRAVNLRSGRHIVRFDYRPNSVAAGAAISGTAAALMMVLAVRPRRRSADADSLARSRRPGA